jgi:hypothetical protein
VPVIVIQGWNIAAIWTLAREGDAFEKEEKSMGMILIIIVILVLVGALPTWPHSKSWGYYPSGGLGLVLLIVIILLLMGRIWSNLVHEKPPWIGLTKRILFKDISIPRLLSYIVPVSLIIYGILGFGRWLDCESSLGRNDHISSEEKEEISLSSGNGAYHW